MPSHLCTLLGCIVIEGVEPSALPSVRQESGLARRMGLVHASVTTTCDTSIRQSSRSASQLDCWIRTSNSRNSRAT